MTTREVLRLRQSYLRKAREFFSGLGVLEVDTEMLSEFPALDPNIEPFSTLYFEPGYESKPTVAGGAPLYLHTSPEYAMKRLLSEGSGPIYQISHVFRNGEKGRIHNPEFTMLEWYRPGFSLEDLMEEVSGLIETMLRARAPIQITYRELFERELSLNPLSVSCEELIEKCVALNLPPPDSFKNEKDTLLQYLLSQAIEPGLGFDRPTFVYNYPPSQAALAKVSSDHDKVAMRFELYINGIELANGYHELTDPVELEQRFAKENRLRIRQGKRPLPPDLHLLDALKKGLPECSGVALGFDRLIMLATKAESVHDILPLSNWKP